MRDDKARRPDGELRASESTDALYDTSEPAMSERIVRFRQRVQQSPVDHALQILTMAVEDVDAAILLARTPEELAMATAALDVFISRLTISASVAATLESMKDWL